MITRLNYGQRSWLVAFLLVFALMGLFPPWTKSVVDWAPKWDSVTGPVPMPLQHQEPAGYGFVFAVLQKNASTLHLLYWWEYGQGERVDWSRLLVQWLVLAALAGVNMVLLIEPEVSVGDPLTSSPASQSPPLP